MNSYFRIKNDTACLNGWGDEMFFQNIQIEKYNNQPLTAKQRIRTITSFDLMRISVSALQRTIQWKHLQITIYVGKFFRNRTLIWRQTVIEAEINCRLFSYHDFPGEHQAEEHIQEGGEQGEEELTEEEWSRRVAELNALEVRSEKSLFSHHIGLITQILWWFSKKKLQVHV